jgi:serine/threonine protein kinase
VVHGDVSPSNILIGFDGTVKLADFGVAQRAGLGGRRGKRTYAAPEQLAGLPFDRRADLYAVGAVAHELLTGRRHDGQTPLPGELGRIVERALRLPPDERFATAEAMQLALERVLVAEGAAALTPRLARFMSALFTEAEVADQRGLEDDSGETTAPLPQPEPPEPDTGPPAASSSALPVPDPAPPRRRRLFAIAAGLLVAGGALVAGDRVDLAGPAAALPSFAAAPLLPAPPPPPPLDADCGSIHGPGGAKVASCPENASRSTSSSSGSGASATSSSTR